MGKSLKKHLSIEEQVDVLESRGLTIEDRNEALRFLEHVNYYRFSGYLFAFRDPEQENHYLQGSSFHQLSRIYEFDAKFARILMYALEDVEETLKTRLSYTLSAYDPDDPLVYLSDEIYRPGADLNRFRESFDSAVRKNKNLPFVRHHLEHYDGKLPIWVAVEILTMGNVCFMYDNLIPSLQKSIAAKYHTGPVQLENWIRNLTYTRNHLAHYMRTYDYSFGRIPKACRNHSMNAVYRGKIFDQVAVMSFLFSTSENWNGYVLEEIEKLFSSYRDSVKIDALGFPKDWKTVLRI